MRVHGPPARIPRPLATGSPSFHQKPPRHTASLVSGRNLYSRPSAGREYKRSRQGKSHHCHCHCHRRRRRQCLCLATLLAVLAARAAVDSVRGATVGGFGTSSVEMMQEK